MNNTYSDIGFNTYTYTDNKKRLISCRYVFLMIISFVLVSMGTCWLYRFINTDNTRIISYDMLLAVKNYNFDLQAMYKRTIMVRMIQIVVLFALGLSKWKNRLRWILPMVVASKIGFILTIFITEMHIYGLINFFIISFPQEIFYICAMVCLVRNISWKKLVLSQNINGVTINKSNVVVCMKILSLWICGVLCEMTINLVLVQRCLIIPNFYR